MYDYISIIDSIWTENDFTNLPQSLIPDEGFGMFAIRTLIESSPPVTMITLRLYHLDFAPLFSKALLKDASKRKEISPTELFTKIEEPSLQSIMQESLYHIFHFAEGTYFLHLKMIKYQDKYISNAIFKYTINQGKMSTPAYVSETKRFSKDTRYVKCHGKIFIFHFRFGGTEISKIRIWIMDLFKMTFLKMVIKWRYSVWVEIDDLGFPILK